MRQLIHVLYIINGTTKNAWYEAESCSSQITDFGGGILEFVDGVEIVPGRSVPVGKDCHEEMEPTRVLVTSVQFAHCEMIKKSPIPDDDTEPDTK